MWIATRRSANYQRVKNCVRRVMFETSLSTSQSPLVRMRLDTLPRSCGTEKAGICRLMRTCKFRHNSHDDDDVAKPTTMLDFSPYLIHGFSRTFLQDWDAISLEMLKNAPSKKPVLSHYPPSHLAKLEDMAKVPASRLCGPVFAGSDLENQIIRLEGASVSVNCCHVTAMPSLVLLTCVLLFRNTTRYNLGLVLRRSRQLDTLWLIQVGSRTMCYFGHQKEIDYV